MNEADFIAALRKLPLHSGARELMDDCALIEIGDEVLVLNHDVMAEGTHFRPGADLADVAWKLVATNLSDLAAKGAEPVGALLGHTLGEGDERFLAGMHEALSKFAVPLMGGDTIAATGPAQFGLTAIGRATHRPVPSRSGAGVGDAVYVTGILGRAMLGFEGVESHLEAFVRPFPRLEHGRALAPVVTAMMDVSDGLLLDSFRLATASAVTVALDREAIPVADPDRIDDAVRWGDDYELLFTAPANAVIPVEAYRIGTIEARGEAPLTFGGVALADPEHLGYRHK